jgi:hypothetical protein
MSDACVAPWPPNFPGVCVSPTQIFANAHMTDVLHRKSLRAAALAWYIVQGLAWFF